MYVLKLKHSGVKILKKKYQEKWENACILPLFLVLFLQNFNVHKFVWVHYKISIST